MPNPHRKHTGPDCFRFGTIAVDLGYIGPLQLKQAIEVQLDDDLAGKPHRVLGAICFDLGWMTPNQIERVLNVMFNARNSRRELRLAAS